MAIIVPNGGSTVTACGYLALTANTWTWLGLRTAAASGSATFYSGSVIASGSELMSISLSPHQVVLFGPFNPPNGITVAGISTASVLYQIKQ